jgi:hypothetical protein
MNPIKSLFLAVSEEEEKNYVDQPESYSVRVRIRILKLVVVSLNRAIVSSGK